MFPIELKRMDRWLCYERATKRPVSPINGTTYIDGTDFANLVDYKTALITKETHEELGLGFSLGYGIVGIDFDHCIDENGCVDTEVMEIITKLNSYTEISHSGTGIHVILNGELPYKGNRGKLSNDINIEMYDKGRYFTMTGRTLRGFTSMRASKAVVKSLQEKYCKRDDVEVPESTIKCKDVDKQLEKALSDKVFSSYYNGDRPTGDESVDDMGFMQKIIFWFGRDPHTCIKVFNMSEYYNTKDDAHKEKADRRDYLPRTFDNANKRQVVTYFDEDKTVNIKNGDGSYSPSKHYGYNDSGNAQRFSDKYGTILRFNHTNNSWLDWEETKWVYDTTSHSKRLFNELLLDMQKEAFNMPIVDDADEEKKKNYLKWIDKSNGHHNKNNALSEASALEPIACSSESFDTDPNLFNTLDGTVELDTINIREHKSEDMLTQIAPTHYGTGVPKRWIQFIDEITCNDKELAQYLQRCVGYSLTGDTSEQCMFFLYGMGANGKSTFLDIITALMGDYAKNAESRTLMVKTHDSSANSDIARLQGARFVTVVETNEQQALDESLVKHITGGEVVTARYLYGHEFQYTPQFKIWIATNHKPLIRGTDNGIWRRIKLIPFLATFDDTQKDVNLKDKLIAELPDIFAWAIEGLKAWQEQGLNEPDMVKKAVRDYQREMNSVGQFFDECIMITNDRDDKVTSSDMYEAYQKWSTFNDFCTESHTRFSSKLKQYCPIKVMLHGMATYRGVKLIDTFEDDFGDTPLESYTKDNVIQIVKGEQTI